MNLMEHIRLNVKTKLNLVVKITKSWFLVKSRQDTMYYVVFGQESLVETF